MVADFEEDVSVSDDRLPGVGRSKHGRAAYAERDKYPISIVKRPNCGTENRGARAPAAALLLLDVDGAPATAARYAVQGIPVVVLIRP